MIRQVGFLLVVTTITVFAALDLPNEPTPAPPAVKPPAPPPPAPVDELGVIFDLLDGSRIVGRIKPRNLPVPLLTDSIGEVKIPLERIRGIQFAASNQPVVVTMQNGDKLRGKLKLDSLRLQTAFGVVTLPVAVARECRVTADGGAAVSGVVWEKMPFPTDCDWPGARGVESVIGEEDLVLKGYPLRSRETYGGPLTIEFEVTLEDYIANDGGFNLQFIREGTPRELTGVDYVTAFCLGYQRRTGGDGHVTVDYRGVNQRLSRENMTIKKGEPYRVKVEASRDRLRINVNGQTYESQEIGLPDGKYYLRLWGWQPTNRWRVKNFSVR